MWTALVPSPGSSPCPICSLLGWPPSASSSDGNAHPQFSFAAHCSQCFPWFCSSSAKTGRYSSKDRSSLPVLPSACSPATEPCFLWGNCPSLEASPFGVAPSDLGMRPFYLGPPPSRPLLSCLDWP